jgi:hypothetical protein
MITIEAADAYILANCLVVDDWSAADPEKKQRYLNVSARTLGAAFPSHTIPDDAVADFANTLTVAFNDTNVFARMGVQTVNLDGVASFTFQSGVIGADDLSRLITKDVRDLINSAPENAGLPKLSAGRKVRAVVP